MSADGGLVLNSKRWKAINRTVSAAVLLTLSGLAFGAATDTRFVKTGTEVSDSVTGLVWQASDASGPVLYTSATCPSGYRIPTINELVSLVDVRQVAAGASPSADPILGLANAFYWTSDTVPGSGGSDGWYVVFSVTSSSWIDYGNFGATKPRLRCVR